MRHIILIIALSIPCFPQAWSGILDSSRATDWSTGIGFTIPSYSVNCSTQPSLTAGSGNAAANTTAINSAIASCDATHNVVNLASGTYYVNGINYNKQNNVVVRGAGPNSTHLMIAGGGQGCLGYSNAGAFCMGGSALYAQSAAVLPGNNNVCSWTAGYAKGSTSLTFSSCGAGTSLAVGMTVILDQQDDSSDTGGIWLCSSFNTVGPPYCQVNSLGSGTNADGRVISGHQYSQQQVALVTGTSSNCSGGSCTVTIAAPGVLFNNVRVGQTPGVWWPTQIATLEGLENVTLEHVSGTSSQYGGMLVWCSQCWLKNVRSILGGQADHYIATTSYEPVVRDSYFYGSQHSGSGAYCIQMVETTGFLIENNIIQNTVSPDIKDAATGGVSGYNFTPYINFASYMQGMYASHNSGSAFNLLEGNSTTSFIGDDVWGTSDLITMFRNQATGWQPGYVNQTIPVIMNEGVRAINVIGNVLGQPSYHTQYEVFPTGAQTVVHNFVTGGSTTAGAGTVSQSIYEIGTVDAGGLGNCTADQNCDTISHTSLMRWGNYDTLQAAVTWDNTESSPGAVTYVNAQSTPASHTLPSSFYLSSKPYWFRSVPFPTYGPDVTSGTTGICVGGTYAGLEATSSGQCTGGTLTAHAWGGFANVNPAQDCYLNVMNGPPDGSGGVLSFDANTCYAASSQAAAPTCDHTSGTYGGTFTNTCSTSSTGTVILCWSTSTLPVTNGLGTGCTTGTSMASGGSTTISSTETFNIVAGTSTLADSSETVYSYTINNAAPGTIRTSGTINTAGTVRQ